MMNNLLVNPKARAKYDLDDYRKEAVLRVRRYMNEILLDQLPVLKDLQRVLDELTIGVSSQPDESQTGRLIIEQVPFRSVVLPLTLQLPLITFRLVDPIHSACRFALKCIYTV